MSDYVSWAALVGSGLAVFLSRRYALMARKSLEESREAARGAGYDRPGS
ncbi:hypothetical protein ACKI16_29655 [Streptomyces scabiei]